MTLDRTKKYRLITRSDFDGLACAMLLKELELINEIVFVHPKDMQDGRIPVTSEDIIANLPYQKSAAIVFDHHSSEITRNSPKQNHIIHPDSPSAARVIFEYFGGEKSFPGMDTSLITAVDQADSARFTIEDVLKPRAWVLLSFLMDSRTGLGRFKNFTISNVQLMLNLIDQSRKSPIEEILNLPDVLERSNLYREHQEKARVQILQCAKKIGKLVVLDLRKEEVIYCTNRFFLYALFPDASVSIHVLWGLQKQNTVLAMGKSIFDRSCKVNLGELALRYGGGGHNAAATCQIANEEADGVLERLISELSEK